MTPLWLGRSSAGSLTLDANALVTHGVCIGMTGSGKTGLCIALMEEVAGSGIPIFAIDPKGDLANLAITEADPEDAEAWKEGQRGWGIDAASISGWRARVFPRIYTPGSDAGLGVDVLGALQRPSANVPAEDRRMLVTGTVSALLGLVGIDADPMVSPAHVVLSRILGDAWERGEDPDIVALLTGLVQPPFTTIGVFPTDTFFPPDKRLALAMHFNALVASPAFGAWAMGAPLDVPSMAARVDGRTPINIFSIAHLTEPERHFFVGILLDRIAAWTRTLEGTDRLRALVFFDEIWGFLPPHPANPPAKQPLLTLLKQARAVGVGVVLATQNPVDVDYKALSNAGTWFIGRLQTRNDRDRVREGLTGVGMSASDVETMLDGVGPRRFLLHRVGAAPMLFDTRWTRVFLAGPVSRARLKQLNPVVQTPRIGRVARPPIPTAVVDFPPWPGSQWSLSPGSVFAAHLQGAFEPWRESAGERWRAGLLVEVKLSFEVAKVGFSEERAETRVYFPLEDSLPFAPLFLSLEQGDISDEPPSGVPDAIPEWLDDLREVERAAKAVVAGILAVDRANAWENRLLKLHSDAGEDRAAFDTRCTAEVERRLADELRALQRSARKRLDSATEQVRRAQEKVDRYAVTASGRQTEEIVNAGETVLGFFFGRRKSVSALATKRRQVVEADMRVDAANQDLAAANAEVATVRADLAEAEARARPRHEDALKETVPREIGLRRDDVRLVRYGLLWVPVGAST